MTVINLSPVAWPTVPHKNINWIPMDNGTRVNMVSSRQSWPDLICIQTCVPTSVDD